jgi:hypothetical protein
MSDTATQGLLIRHRPEPRGRGCLLTAIIWLAWNGMLHARVMISHVSQAMLDAMAPVYIGMLNASHSNADRAAFSNAFSHLTDIVVSTALVDTPAEAQSAFNALARAARNRTITPAESAAFVSNVWTLPTLTSSVPVHTP